MSRVLVTGGSGFIGTSLVQHYVARGMSVRSLDRAPPRNPEHAPLWQETDLLDTGAVAAAVRDFQPDCVFHLGARTDLDDRDAGAYAVNTTGVRNVIAAVRNLPRLERVVFGSSMLVCKLGHVPRRPTDFLPTTAYGESKAEGERIVRAEAGDAFVWTIVRPTSIWGPWFDVPYKSFFTAIQRGRYFHPRGRTIRRSYGFVGNAVHQLAALARADARKVASRVFYLADYEPTDLRVWSELIGKALGARPIRDVPVSLLRLGAWAGDLLGLVRIRAPLTSFRLDNLLTSAIYDLEPTRAVAGALPFSLADGVALTADWLRAQSR